MDCFVRAHRVSVLCGELPALADSGFGFGYSTAAAKTLTQIQDLCQCRHHRFCVFGLWGICLLLSCEHWDVFAVRALAASDVASQLGLAPPPIS